MQVGEETVSQSLFNLTGMAKKAASPNKAEDHYAQCQGDNHSGIGQKFGAGGLVASEIVHSQLDYPGNQELQKIHQQQ